MTRHRLVDLRRFMATGVRSYSQHKSVMVYCQICDVKTFCDSFILESMAIQVRSYRQIHQICDNLLSNLWWLVPWWCFLQGSMLVFVRSCSQTHEIRDNLLSEPWLTVTRCSVTWQGTGLCRYAQYIKSMTIYHRSEILVNKDFSS